MMIVSPPFEPRIAMMYTPSPDFATVGGYMMRALEKLCYVEQFVAGTEPEGFDHYFYLDDSPTHYMAPKYHPASYWAIDMVLPKLWFLQDAEQYYRRMCNFDYCYVTNTSALEYCQERGMDAKFLGFAADPEYHHPYNIARDLDWVALWHNCGDRIDAVSQAAKLYPNGHVGWACWHDYAEYISRGRCVLNMLRGNMLNMRVFEAMAIGTPLITTRHPDMAYFGFQENEHYLGFDNVDEMLDQIGWVQANPYDAAQMALRARLLVFPRHTYDQRAQEIII